VKTYSKEKQTRTGSPDGGGRSLDNWQFRMNERKQVMKTMSSKFEDFFCFRITFYQHEKQNLFLDELKRTPATLLMNQTDRWRERKELLELMDATLPLLQNGKNCRLNSEFWTQQQLIGNDDTGIQ
jgi:hypothetical protein